MVAIARPSSSRAGKAQRRQEVAAAETAVQEANLAQQRAADQLLRGLEALPFAALQPHTARLQALLAVSMGVGTRDETSGPAGEGAPASNPLFPTLVEHNGTLGSSGSLR